jgi:hypothetical protein
MLSQFVNLSYSDEPLDRIANKIRKSGGKPLFQTCETFEFES